MEATQVVETAVKQQARQTGTVNFFNPQKGWGFISPSDGGPDIFVHHTGIKMNGYRTLAENQRVEFEVVSTPKGLSAANVQPIAD